MLDFKKSQELFFTWYEDSEPKLFFLEKQETATLSGISSLETGFLHGTEYSRMDQIKFAENSL